MYMISLALFWALHSVDRPSTAGGWEDLYYMEGMFFA